MPRYFLNLENHDGLTLDEEGQELADDGAAITEAGRALATTMAEDVALHRSPVSIVIHVVREDGSAVATVTANSRIDRA